MENDTKILILTTGGTILSVFDPEQKSVAPGLKGHELVAPLLGSLSGVVLEVQDFVQKPGPHLTPDIALELALHIQQMNLYDGFVVIQGTDTVEEFSYMLSLVIPPDKPVVVTGAMKSRNERYADGLGNIASSVEVARSPKSKDRGVLVVMNERIFSPGHIFKMHTSNMDSFQAPDTGPLGSVIHGEVCFYHEKQAPKPIYKKAEPRVELLKATLGAGAFLLEACVEAGVQGLVIEGFGAGNVPPDWVPGIAKAIQKGVPVIIASRCPQGSVSPVYDYAGGGKSLEQLGAQFAGHLSGPKARIKLMLLLGQTPRPTADEIGAAFREE